jgi:hypothetical protein
MSTVAVDIDSTLYDFDTLAREAALALWLETGDEVYRKGIYYSSEDWRAPAELMGFEHWVNGVIARCHDDEMILKQAPFPGAVDTCMALIEAGHKLIYISNRATETESATREWLDKNGFLTSAQVTAGESYGDSNTSVVITTGDKRPFIKDAQYIIDDRLKTCVEFVYDYEWQHFYGERGAVKGPSKKERSAFVLKYPYNQNATDIPGLYVAPTWAGLNVYMHRRGLLPELAVAAMA